MTLPRTLLSLLFINLASLGLPAMATNLGASFWAGYYHMDKDAAEADQYNDSGLGLGGDINFTYRGFRGALGVGGILLSDNDSFQQTVEDEYGQMSVAESSVEATAFTFELGYEYNVTPSLVASMSAGYMLLTGSRFISNCSGCHEEELKMENGYYVQPEVGYYFSNWGVGAAYLYSPESTLTSGFTVNLLARF